MAAAAAEKITPLHLARERIVYPTPAVCPCCGGGSLRKIGEDGASTGLGAPASVALAFHACGR